MDYKKEYNDYQEGYNKGQSDAKSGYKCKYYGGNRNFARGYNQGWADYNREKDKFQKALNSYDSLSDIEKQYGY